MFFDGLYKLYIWLIWVCWYNLFIRLVVKVLLVRFIIFMVWGIWWLCSNVLIVEGMVLISIILFWVGNFGNVKMFFVSMIFLFVVRVIKILNIERLK